MFSFHRAIDRVQNKLDFSEQVYRDKAEMSSTTTNKYIKSTLVRSDACIDFSPYIEAANTKSTLVRSDACTDFSPYIEAANTKSTLVRSDACTDLRS
jgi:hypothetical protein